MDAKYDDRVKGSEQGAPFRYCNPQKSSARIYHRACREPFLFLTTGLLNEAHNRAENLYSRRFAENTSWLQEYPAAEL